MSASGMDSSKLVRLVRQVSKEAKASKPFTSFTLKIDGKHNPAALPDGDCWGRNPITWLSVEVVAGEHTQTDGSTSAVFFCLIGLEQ